MANRPPRHRANEDECSRNRMAVRSEKRGSDANRLDVGRDTNGTAIVLVVVHVLHQLGDVQARPERLVGRGCSAVLKDALRLVLGVVPVTFPVVVVYEAHASSEIECGTALHFRSCDHRRSAPGSTLNTLKRERAAHGDPIPSVVLDHPRLLTPRRCQRSRRQARRNTRPPHPSRWQHQARAEYLNQGLIDARTAHRYHWSGSVP